MERLGEHVAECPVCLAVLEQLPEDSMVRLLQEHRSVIAAATGEPTGVGAEIEGAGRLLDVDAVPRNGLADAGPTGSFTAVDQPEVDRVPVGPFQHPRYQVQQLLGGGGMGLVYLADDRIEGRPVVLKFLRDDLLDHPRLVARFQREAAAATRLKHPNIVIVYGAESFGQWPALVMEYVEGTDLARLIEQTAPFPVRMACEIVRQAALGLQYSFERGMVHRDIKPSNLMVNPDGAVKILDFGLAKMQSELCTDPGLTSTGAFLGSVDYMAPEQADDPRRADIRADIYSLGCTFYHLLSGAPPFKGTTFEVLEAHRRRKPPPLNQRRPEVPAELAALVSTMMAKQPAGRFQTPGQVAEALAPFLEVEGEGITSHGPFVRRFGQPAASLVAPGKTGDKPLPVSAAAGSDRSTIRRRLLRRALATAAVVILAALAGLAIYRWSILKGELVIETDLPNAEIFVLQDGKRVATILTGQTKRIELDPGRYELAPASGDAGLRFSTETLVLRRWDRIDVSVRRVSDQPDALFAKYLGFIRRIGFTKGAVDARYDRRPSDDRTVTTWTKEWITNMVNSNKWVEYFRSADSRYTLGVLFARHGWMEWAIEFFELAIAARPGDADALFNLGVALGKQGRLADAIADFREVVRLQPDAVDVHMALGLSLADHGDLDEALSEVRTAVRIRPVDADSWYNLGIVLRDRGQPTQAIDAFAQAIRIDPEMADAHALRGHVLVALGRRWEADAERREAIRLRGVAVAQNNRGIELAEMGHTEEAIGAFRKAIRIQPEFIEARNNLGVTLFGCEEVGAAIAELTEALRLQPGPAAVHLNLGIALKRIGAGREAEPFYREAVRLQPNIDTSRPCWARSPAAVENEPSRRFPGLRGPRPR
jgi:tetratricopeptide (TPR) repeat protein